MPKNQYIKFFNILLLFVVSLSSCTTLIGKDFVSNFEPPAWKKPPLMLDLSHKNSQVAQKYSNEPPQLEFSSTGCSNYLLAWWYPKHRRGLSEDQLKHEDDQKRLMDTAIISLEEERVVDTSFDGIKHFDDRIEKCFPDSLWRQRYLDFVKKANVWKISNDFNRMIVFTKKESFVAELWDFRSRPKCLWSKELKPPCHHNLIDVFFIEREKYSAVLLCFWDGAAIISQEKGELLDFFSYGIPNSDATRKAYREKFNLWSVREKDNSLDFDVFQADYCPEKRWIACGTIDRREIRIVSVDSKHDIINILNADAPPDRPTGGSWKVRRLSFAGQGKYLLVEYDFSGRLAAKTIESTEIYDTETWKLVWYENKRNITSVIISPDGKKIAFMRDQILEIGDFIPQEINLN